MHTNVDEDDDTDWDVALGNWSGRPLPALRAREAAIALARPLATGFTSFSNVQIADTPIAPAPPKNALLRAPVPLCQRAARSPFHILREERSNAAWCLVSQLVYCDAYRRQCDSVGWGVPHYSASRAGCDASAGALAQSTWSRKSAFRRRRRDRRVGDLDIAKTGKAVASGLASADGSSRARKAGKADTLPITERDIPIGIVGLVTLCACCRLRLLALFRQ